MGDLAQVKWNELLVPVSAPQRQIKYVENMLASLIRVKLMSDMLPGYGIFDGSEKHVLNYFFCIYQPILTRLGALFWKFYPPYLVFETQNDIYTGSGSNSPISGIFENAQYS